MAAQHSCTLLLLIWIIACVNGKNPVIDLQVTCIFSEDCVLPCHFEPVGDEIIYWYKQNVLIYTYRQGSGLLDQSTHLYTGRISLFNGTINFGNASLHIQKCSQQDKGKYKCLVASGQKKNEHFITVKVEEIYSVEGQDFIIPCVAPWDLENFPVTWSFIKEYNTSIIYTYDSITHLSYNVWKGKVWLVSPRGQIGDGSLQIRNPLRLEHAGIYTCVLSALQTKHEVRTTVNIVAKTAKTQHKSSPQWIPPALISCLVLAAIIAVIVIVKRKVCRSRSTQTYGEDTDIHQMRDSQISLPCNVTNANSGEPSESTCLSEGIDRNT